MSKHTPGPWKAFARDENNYSLDDVMTEAKPHKRICNAYGGTSDSTSEYAANARLIAAAPDLLDACKLALAYLEDTGSGFFDQLTPHEKRWHIGGEYGDFILLERFRAVIAKATN